MFPTHCMAETKRFGGENSRMLFVSREGLPVEVTFRHAEQQLLEALAARRFTPWSTLDERIAAERQSLAKGFDRLLALEEVDVQLYDHQRRAVLRVLQDMRGRALLADEVGLGKTIEAGVVLKEYLVRGLARKVLILVPAPLTEQWRAELHEKLAIEAHVNRDIDGWGRADCIIASLDTAKRPDHAARIHAIAWDVVIVDEAHRLKNRDTAAWRFVDGIRTKYVLLLTATPIQNDLEELYNMMTLLKPGLLQTYSVFRQDFMVDKRSPKQLERLREYVREVMIRSTRQDCSVPFPKRIVESVPIPLTGAERAFYDDVLTFARRAYGKQSKGNVLPLILLLRELCSSPQAARRTLLALGNSDGWAREERATALDLAARTSELCQRPSKLASAVEVMRRHDEPIIVFTEFRATQDALYDILGARGVPVSKFHGEMNSDQRRQAVDAFRRGGGVLISTEAGAEGRNLQFCRTVMNYDLPWNPMRVEQRIGRVHRLGQSRDVVVINLHTEDTIETYVYRLLHDKIRLFQQVIGDLDLILTAVADEHADSSFERAIGQLILESGADEQLDAGFTEVGRRLEQARREREEIHRLNDHLLNDHPFTDALLNGGSPSDDSPLNTVADPATGSNRAHRPNADASNRANVPTGPNGVSQVVDEAGRTVAIRNKPAGEVGRKPAVECGAPSAMMAGLLHPLCLDVDFARGVLADEPTVHAAASAMRATLATIRFMHVRTRPVQRRLVHHRHIVFWFRVAYRSDETREQLYTVLLDPVTEEARPLPTLHHAIDIGWDAVDGPGAENGTVGGGVGAYALKRLYRRACRHVNEELLRGGLAHQAEARTRLARDKVRLESYYDGLLAEALAPVARDLRRLEAARTRRRLMESVFADSKERQESVGTSINRQLRQWEENVQRTMDALAAEQQRRIDELERKYTVRAEAVPLGAALLWVPRVEWRYKLLGHVRREIVFYYDPIQDTVVDLACEECGEPMTTVYACTSGELVCSGCHVSCSNCSAPLPTGDVPRRCHVCDTALCSSCDTACPDRSDLVAEPS